MFPRQVKGLQAASQVSTTRRGATDTTGKNRPYYKIQDPPATVQDPITYDPLMMTYTWARQTHWDKIARLAEKWRGLGGYYHRRLAQIYSFLVAPNQRVLEIGSGMGDLLAAVVPSVGVGVDFSLEMTTRAAEKYPALHFIHADAHNLAELERYADTPFDVIILSDLLNDVWDVQSVLEQVMRFSDRHTRIIINSYSRLWQLPLSLAQKLGLAKPVVHHNWLTVEDLIGLLVLSGCQTIRSWQEILLPLPIPLVASLANRILVKLPLFRWLALTNFIVAQPLEFPNRIVRRISVRSPSVSVIVPARNEAGNIEGIFEGLPEIGSETELVFVEGNSTDGTYATIECAMAEHPERRCKLLRQSGVGKGDAVRLGFEAANGDILMILDADLTVPPRDLRRFYDALNAGKGEFINGVRLTYPMQARAMRFANLVGNKFFSLAFSMLLGQPIKDTLCGTKVLWRRDYRRIAANRSYFGDFDPFGDFDLLFGAAKLNLKIIDLPVRYRDRTYGTTNIQRWKHGWILLKMMRFACGRIKFL